MKELKVHTSRTPNVNDSGYVESGEGIESFSPFSPSYSLLFGVESGEGIESREGPPRRALASACVESGEGIESVLFQRLVQ